MVHGTDQGVLVRAAVHEGVDALRPGQFIEARLSRVAGGRALRLPAPALVRIDGIEKVFVERAEGFEPVAVKVLSRENGEVVARGALRPGDQVVVNGTVAMKAALAATSNEGAE
jgi:multidrug efflux pump subunit AcrA (membrane-fusion protein)